MKNPGPLPYTDTKPIGAADFYFAINATFRFILKKFGADELKRYWTELGENYFAPVSTAWKSRGLDGVAEYWKAFFAAEPNAIVEITPTKNSVTLDVKVCPAIKHLRDNKREIVPCFCQHCYFVGEAMAQSAGLMVRIEGGNGACRQIFSRRNAGIPPQDLSKIAEATC